MRYALGLGCFHFLQKKGFIILFMQISYSQHAIVLFKMACLNVKDNVFILYRTISCLFYLVLPCQSTSWGVSRMLLPLDIQKMNTSTTESVVTTCPQTMRYELNTSCNWSWPLCNWTSSGDRLLLPTFSTAAKVRVIITFILCIISAFCNLAVLWASNGKNKRKSHVRVLILNLTVADLLVTFIVMPVDAVWNITVQWLAGDFACRLLMFLKLQAMYSCAFVTVVISLDRQSAILNPLAINKARRRNKCMLTVAWLMSIALSVPQVRSCNAAGQSGACLFSSQSMRSSQTDSYLCN